MPITFVCPNCKRSLTVADNLAGKRGSCRNCKTILTVPTPGGARQAAPAAPVDVEAAAAALLADEPQHTPAADTRTVELTCPFCDAQVKLGADVAGKRAPCPECRRIIKVPELVKQERKDWRKMDDNLPLGARRPDQPAPEGAWGSTGANLVSREALVGAKVLPKTRQPIPTSRKILWGAAAAGLLCLLGGGALVGYKWLARGREQQAIQTALDYAGSENAKTQVGPEGVAALHRLAGEYYLKTNRAAQAGEQFEKALRLLTAPGDQERDAELLELAWDVAELGGSSEEVDSGARLKWDEVHKTLGATLRALRAPEARVEALRGVARRLIARGQPDRPEALAAAVFAASPAERAEAMAVVSLELHAADKKPQADRAANEALQTYAGEPGAVPLSAPVVALAVVLNRSVPKPGKAASDEEAIVRGRAEGLARQGQWDAARKQAQGGPSPEVKVQALLAVADAALEAKAGGAEDAEAAVQLAEAELKGKRDTGWLLVRLVRVAGQAGVAPEKLQGVANNIPEAELRGRAQLAAFRARLGQGKQVVEESAADGVDGKTVSHQLARAYLARHNVRQGGDFAKVVQGWPEPQKAYGSVGAAMAMAGVE
jgi:hypothetical protein